MIQYNCSTCKERKFLLFAGFGYYPDGGWKDFKNIYDTLEQAIVATDSLDGEEWFEIVSIEQLKVVHAGTRHRHGEWNIHEL